MLGAETHAIILPRSASLQLSNGESRRTWMPTSGSIAVMSSRAEAATLGYIRLGWESIASSKNPIGLSDVTAIVLNYIGFSHIQFYRDNIAWICTQSDLKKESIVELNRIKRNLENCRAHQLIASKPAKYGNSVQIRHGKVFGAKTNLYDNLSERVHSLTRELYKVAQTIEKTSFELKKIADGAGHKRTEIIFIRLDQRCKEFEINLQQMSCSHNSVECDLVFGLVWVPQDETKTFEKVVRASAVNNMNSGLENATFDDFLDRWFFERENSNCFVQVVQLKGLKKHARHFNEYNEMFLYEGDWIGVTVENGIAVLSESQNDRVMFVRNGRNLVTEPRRWSPLGNVGLQTTKRVAYAFLQCMVCDCWDKAGYVFQF